MRPGKCAAWTTTVLLGAWALSFSRPHAALGSTWPATRFPSEVSAALVWVDHHQQPGGGLPQPAGPQSLPRSPSGYGEVARITPNGYAVGLWPLGHRVNFSVDRTGDLPASREGAPGFIAWSATDEGLGANIPQFAEALNHDWRKPVGLGATIRLGPRAVGHWYRDTTTAAVGNPARSMSVLTWSHGPWILEISGGGREQDVGLARELIGPLATHRLPPTLAGVLAVKIEEPDTPIAVSYADWMPNGGTMTQLENTIATVGNPMGTCRMLFAWRPLNPY